MSLQIDPSTPPAPPQVSFIIATHNRRAVLLRTLQSLLAVPELKSSTGAPAIPAEIIVIDNACTDGTAKAVAEKFPAVRVLQQPRNFGACAKNAGVEIATGQYVIFLDDDSYPTPGSTGRMIQYFLANQNLGAVVFDVLLKDGTRECSAYPTVFIGCGVGFRREALAQVGGLPSDFFYQAEEYDLSFRLLNARWDIQRRDDVQVLHLKTKTSRHPARTTRLDARNNFTLITRYFPTRWLLPFAVTWMRRYRWIALTKGWRHHVAFWLGLAQGVQRSLRPGHRRPVTTGVFERFAMIDLIESRMAELATAGCRSVLFVDVGKNILPFYLAARATGVKVVAIADKNLAKPGRRFRGIPVIDDASAAQLQFDMAIVSNVSPVHVAQRLTELRALITRPVIDLLEPPLAVAKVA
jgi:GT2 family glycosyltransferase